MKTIKKDELFQNLGGFLKSKGIELNQGTYTRRIQQSCNLLSDAINATQHTVKRTRVHVDNALDKLRQSIHEHTAPEQPTAASTAGPSSSAKSGASGGKRAATPGTKPSSASAKKRRRKQG